MLLSSGLLVLLPLAGPLEGIEERHGDLGITVERPRSYESIPVSPVEPWVRLHYVERADADRERTHRPGFKIVEIPRAGSPRAASRPTEAPRSVVDLPSYIAVEWPFWRLDESRELADDGQGTSSEHRLVPTGFQNPGWIGFIRTLHTAERTLALLGFCARRDLPEQAALWRRVASRLEVFEPEPRVFTDRKLELYYARSGLARPELRISVRKSLVPGWRWIDTENYIVVFDTKNQPLVKRVARDLEMLRGHFEEMFPPADELDAVATVRICKDRQEYLQYGGDEWSQGYWQWEADEIVLYDTAAGAGRRAEPETLANLYHEAFHQYVHHAVGGYRPHPWFDEGLGDYFGGALVKNGNLIKIEPNEARLAGIRARIANGSFVPWSQFVHQDWRAFYPREQPDWHYSQAWSMVYFLKTSKQVARREEWSRILPTYFEVLRDVFAEELAFSKGEPGAAARATAARVARERAIDAALYGVDLTEIENAWIEFLDSL